jgi:threonine aldolase
MVLTQHHFEHMVKPKLVYISNPTELGTVYSKLELQELSGFCRDKGLILYLDGARLGAALTIKHADVTLEDIYSLTDAFFIGGTKTGALLGEALVVRKHDLKEELRYIIKQKGGLLAKGSILGIQFEVLFKDDLYFELARHANKLAQQIVTELTKIGCRFWVDSPSNQIFPILEHNAIKYLEDRFQFYTWLRLDNNHSAVRLVTSWATPAEAVESFMQSCKTACRNGLVHT